MEIFAVACSDTETEHNYSDSGCPRMRRPRVVVSSADLVKFKQARLYEESKRRSIPASLEQLRFHSFSDSSVLAAHVRSLSKSNENLSKNDSSCTRNQGNVRHDTTCRSNKLLSHNPASRLNRKLHASRSWSSGSKLTSMMRRSTLLKTKRTKHLKSRSLSFEKGVLEPNDLQELCQQQEDTSLVISNVHISISRNSSMVWKDREPAKQMSSSSLSSLRSRRAGLVNQSDEIGQKADTRNDVINEQDSESDSAKDEDHIVEEKPEEREESLLEAITKTAPFKKLSCPIEVASRDSGHVSDEAATVSSHGPQRTSRTLSLCSDIVINTTPEFQPPSFKPKTSNDSSSFSHGIPSRAKQNVDEVDSSSPPPSVVIEKSGTKRHSSDPVGSSNALNHVTPRIGSILESSVKEQRPSSFHAYESTPITVSGLSNRAEASSSENDVRVTPCSDQSSTTGPISVEDLDIGNLETDWDERRELVAKWLLETEISYVNGLQAIIQDYMVPLQQPQTPMLLGLSVVKEIFFQIPDLHLWHKNFLTQVKERVENWHSMGKVGDLFVASFSENKLMETYSKFINNFMQAKSNIQIAKMQLPMFAKFLETASRESRDKLSLSDLLIKPVQRIPRYVLFIKDLLKQTPQLHPDRQLLSQALEEMTTLAELMNESEQEAHRMDQLREFVSNIEGAPNLIVPKRTLIQHDPVTELRGSVMKKDRSLFIFNDILMCASARRKTASSFRRGSISRFSLAPSDHWTFRYKFLWQAPLTAVTLTTDIQKTAQTARHRNGRASLDRSGARLVQDEATLIKMLEMAKSIGLPHQQLESSIQVLLTDVKEQIALKKEQEHCVYSPAAKIDLSVQTEPNAVTQYSFVFINEKAKSSWTDQFIESKRIAEENNMIHGSMTSLLSQAATGPQLTFLYPMTLQLCRFGMQLKCAATGLPVDNSCSNSLWVCRSDVYGGQVCLLHVEPQNKLRLMASITVCSSQIRCIAAIPQVTPKTPINAEEYFGSNLSQSEAIAYYHHERFESTSSIGGVDSDSDLVSSECSNSNLLEDQRRRPTSGTFGGSNESIQTLTEASEVEDTVPERRLVNRISTGTLLADESDRGTLTRKKALLDRRNSTDNESSQSVPLPRRHFSLIAKRNQADQELLSSLKDYNRSTSVPAVNCDVSTKPGDWKLQIAGGSQRSIDSESNCSYDDNTPVTTPTTKNTMLCPLPDKQFCDHRPHSPLKKFMHMFSPTPQHRVITPGSTSKISEQPFKYDTLSRPRSVSATSIDPVQSHHQRSSTLGRDRRQFSPMTLKPAHIKMDTSGSGKHKPKTDNSQKTGSSQMWLGTEDKCIYVFGPGDSLRGKSKNTIHMPASVCCIKYHCENVYVGMENGVLAVFSTNCYGVWLFDCPATIQLVEQDNAPVSCCLPVRSVVWVSCSNAIFAVDASLNVEQIISYDDPDIQVLTMVMTPCGVWVALAGSTLLYLYQTSSARLLTTVDCCQPVHTLLTGYDSNLSEEKTANLAITNLLHSQGTLLIGTSAGVVLALELPTSSAHLMINSSLHPIALSHGHKGPVDIMINVYTEAKLNETASSSRKLSRRKSNQKTQSQNSLLVMSCGEGYEDYVSKTTISNIRESVGCLAVWQMSLNNNT